jgi:hypothetical protein
MAISVTTIGFGEEDDKPACEKQEKSSPPLTPTTIKPTVMPAAPAGPALSGRAPISPSRIGTGVSRMVSAADPRATSTPCAPVHPIAVSGIGGASTAKAVPLDALAHRFPGARPDTLARARAVLLGYGSHAAVRPDWLAFGVAGQASVNAALKDQVALLESPGRRDASAHVARLHAMLTDVLRAMDGGFLRKSAHTVWQQHSTEIRRIETLLNRSGNEMSRMLDGIAGLYRRYACAVEELESHYLAGQYLLDSMSGDDMAHLLQSRLTALAASQTLAQENRLILQQQESRLRELAVLIQDGVLVKLPSVLTQIAALRDKPTDTDRYLIREALGNLTQLFERNRAWH